MKRKTKVRLGIFAAMAICLSAGISIGWKLAKPDVPEAELASTELVEVPYIDVTAPAEPEENTATSGSVTAYQSGSDIQLALLNDDWGFTVEQLGSNTGPIDATAVKTYDLWQYGSDSEKPRPQMITDDPYGGVPAQQKPIIDAHWRATGDRGYPKL
jgi:hypothetical protein